MKNWQEEMRHLASKVEHAIDRGRLTLKQKLDLLDDITITPYRGYGSKTELHIKGRVLENMGLDVPPEDASLWENLTTLFHRYESDEIPNAPLGYKFGQEEGQLSTDQEGYFDLNLPSTGELEGWQTIEFTLLKQYKKDQPQVHVQGEVLLPCSSSKLGVLSDLDDTVIVSQATNFFEKSRILVLNNERTRKPFEGVGAFYRALQAGADGKRNNPFFYVSSSSWNLYEMFRNFCRINDLPKGVFLLRDVGLDNQKFYRTGHGTHKLEKISHVLENFSHIPFLLIGDSGQKDPEIYREIVKRYPNRIKGIYIRDVDPQEQQVRDQEVTTIAEEVTAMGVPMLLVQNSHEAAQHAISQGWIPEASLAAIKADVQDDQEQQKDVRHTLGLHKLFS